MWKAIKYYKSYTRSSYTIRDKLLRLISLTFNLIDWKRKK